MILSFKTIKIRWTILINDTDIPGITITPIENYFLVLLVCRSFEELEDKRLYAENYIRNNILKDTVTLK